MNEWDLRLNRGALEIYGPGPVRIVIAGFNPDLTSTSEVGGVVEAVYPLAEDTAGAAPALKLIVDHKAVAPDHWSLQAALQEVGLGGAAPGTWLAIGDLVEWLIPPEFARRLEALLRGQA